MIIDRASPLKLPFGTRRMVEWGIVGLALVMIVLVLVHKMRVIEGQTELSAIKTTLAALRTSFVPVSYTHLTLPTNREV